MARRISFTICSGVARVSDFAVADLRLCLIYASPKGYDEPEILPSSSHPVCLRSAAAGHLGLEYLYVDFGSDSFKDNTDLANHPDDFSLKGDANYAFSTVRATVKHRFQ